MAPNLELKVPPPLVLVAVAAAMWGLAGLGPRLLLPGTSVIGVGLMLAGLALNLAGVAAVRHAKTTFNPLRPETATALVSTGLFGLTRNPMYLGMLLVLVGWAVYLAAPVALLGPVAFVLYITRFQIIPEERALAKLFGEGFAEYRAKVRRWL